MAQGPMLAHSVYFTLTDSSPRARQKLVDDCKEYLTGHPGTVFFAAGNRVEELDRPVNDRDFDVSLLVVFEDKAAHDRYQDASQHHKFIEENSANWKAVRVFDAYVETDKPV